MPRLELSLLGPFSASLDGRPLTRFRSDNARVLLAFLAMHDGERYQRHYLASLFWPDAPPADARTNLRQILYHLRRVLAVPDDGPPFLLADHNSIGFNRESDFQIDVAEFSALMGAVDSHAHHQSASCASCVQHLPAALALYRGDFLSGLPLPNSETFEAWRVVTQERLHLQVVAGIGTLVDHFQEQQDYARAIHYVSHLLTLEPWREEDHRRLMHLLALDGQASAAQAHYEACREILKFELGTEPCPATVDLADAIRTGRFTPAQDRSGVNETIVDVSDQALAASYLPKAERLFGRETELDRLDRWLRHERHQLVTILGMGGVGKTTLAAHVAHNIAAARPRSESGEESSDRGQVFDQVLWRSLVNAPPLSKVLAQWLQLFGNCEVQHHAESTHEQVDLLVACLSQQPTLLILDNLESILDEDAQTGQLQPGYEDYGYLLQAMAERDHCSCLLITSREEPHLLAGLERGKAGVSRLQLAGLSPSAGRQLFRRWSLCGHEKALDMLCDRYSGSPLALELVSETIDELYGGDVQSFLALPFAVFEDIEDVLNQQFERLTALEQSLLYWLAVEREPRSIKELGDNLLGDASPDSVPVAMRRLLRRSLVEKQESDEGTRFYLQNVITEFMTDRLVRNICQEIIAGRVGILNSHALLKATTEAYVVESQQRMIVQPVVSRMKAHFGVGELRRQLQQMVVGLQAPDGPGRGYAAGNLLNLMLSAGLDVQHMDFSGLTLRQVNLQDAVMPHVNLAGVTFRDCSFADTFASLFSLAVSPDGTLLAATTALGSVRIWRRSDGSQVARIPIQPGYLWSVAFGPDGRYLATAGDDARIYLYRVGGEQGDISLTLERVLIGHEGTVRSVCFNPDGTELASGGVDGTVRLWPLATTVEAYPAAAELKGDQHTILFGHTDRVFRVVYSPDGRILASAGADTEIRVWDRTTGASVWTLRGHDERIAALAFAPDGQILASGSVDTQVRLWHMAKGDCVKVLSRHSEPLLAVAFSPDGRYLASAGHGTSITLWETHGWQPIRQFQADAHDGPRIWGLSFSPDSRELISAGAQISMQVWDLPTSLCRLRLHPWHVAHAAVAFHPSGRWIITGSSDGRLRVWDADRAEANLPAVTQSTADSILATALDPQGRQLVTGLSTGLIQVWKVTSGHERVELKLIQEIGDIRNSITQLRYSPDGQTLAACSQQGGFHLWRVSDRPVAPLTSVRHVSAHRHEALALAIHPQGHQAASGGDDRVVRLWDVRTGTGVGTIEVAKSRINSIEYGPDGSMLLVGCADGTIALVQVDARTLFGRFLAHETGTRVVRFAGLHTCVSAGVDGSLAVWRLQGDGTQTCQQRLAGHAGLVFDLQLHPRRPLFVSVGRDSTVRLWDLRAGECLAMWRTPGPYWGTSIDGAWGLTAVEKSNLLALGMVNGNVEDERLTDGINVQPLSVMSKVRPSSGVWLPSNDAIPEWGSTALPERVVRPGLASTAPMA